MVKERKGNCVEVNLSRGKINDYQDAGKILLKNAWNERNLGIESKTLKV